MAKKGRNKESVELKLYSGDGDHDVYFVARTPNDESKVKDLLVAARHKGLRIPKDLDEDYSWW